MLVKPSLSTLLIPLLLSTCSRIPPQLPDSAATQTAAAAPTQQPILYTDQEALALRDLLPSLQEQLANPRPAEEILREIPIDITRLRWIDSVIGDCPTINVYELSPNYVLAAGDNACVEAGIVQIRRK